MDCLGFEVYEIKITSHIFDSNVIHNFRHAMQLWTWSKQ